MSDSMQRFCYHLRQALKDVPSPAVGDELRAIYADTGSEIPWDSDDSTGAAAESGGGGHTDPG